MEEGTGHGDVSLINTGALNDSLEDKIGHALQDDGYKYSDIKTNLTSDYNANINVKEAVPPVNVLLLPCNVCGRTFQPDSLAKHTSICQKTTNKKRKAFDSSRQRREDTDLAQFLPKNFGLPENSSFPEKEKEKPTSTPKMPVKRHSLTSHSRSNGPSKIFATPENSRCPHCGRGFGARAFDRHVAWCAERTRLAIAPGASSGPTEVRIARSRLMARKSYRAPPIKSRRSLTREKYSLSRSASVDSAVSDGSSNAGENRRLTTDGNNTQHLPVIRKTSKHNVNESLMTRSLTTKPRLDDNYDPFLSAKRQMMDLMSSSTNIHKLDTSPIEYKKDPSPFRTSNSVQHTTLRVTRDESSISSTPNAAHSPFQRSRSLRSPSNKYNFTGQLVTTKLSNKSLPGQQNNSNNDKTLPKRSNESPKIKNTNNLKADSKSKSPSYESSPFLNRTEKHRIIKLEPVNVVTLSHNKNNIALLDSRTYNNNLSDSQENFIDPRLINDKIPLSVQKLLDNPVILSSTESLLYDNPPESVGNKKSSQQYKENQLNYDNKGSDTPTIDDLSAQYDKIMVSLEQSMHSHLSTQDEDALYKDLEQLMSSFDDPSSNINSLSSYKKQNLKSTHIKDSLDGLSYTTKNNNVASKSKQVPYNKSLSLNFSSVLNNPLPNPVYPKYNRSRSMLDNQNQQRRLSTKNTDLYKDNESQLESDIIKSLKDIDLMCNNKGSSHKYTNVQNTVPTRKKNIPKTKLEGSPIFKMKQTESERKIASREHSPPNNHSSKYIGDSAYGRNSLNRTSPPNHLDMRRSPSHRAASPSSPTIRLRQLTPSGDGGSSRHSPMRERDYVSPFNKDMDEMIWQDGRLSSSESDASISNMAQTLSRTCSSIISTSRMSRFCHDCGNKFPFEAAKFCIECGARRLAV